MQNRVSMQKNIGIESKLSGPIEFFNEKLQKIKKARKKFLKGSIGSFEDLDTIKTLQAFQEEINSKERQAMQDLYQAARRKTDFSNHTVLKPAALIFMGKYICNYAQFLYLNDLEDLHNTIINNYLNKGKVKSHQKMHYPHAIKYNSLQDAIDKLENAIDLATVYYKKIDNLDADKIKFNKFRKHVERIINELESFHANSKIGIMDELPSVKPNQGLAEVKDSKETKIELPNFDGTLVHADQKEFEKQIELQNERRRQGHLAPDLSNLDPQVGLTLLKRKTLDFHTNQKLSEIFDSKNNEDYELTFEDRIEARFQALMSLDKSENRVFATQLSQRAQEIEQLYQPIENLKDDIGQLKIDLQENYTEGLADQIRVKENDLQTLEGQRKVLREKYEETKELILNKLSVKELEKYDEKFHASLRHADDVTDSMIKAPFPIRRKPKKKAAVAGAGAGAGSSLSLRPNVEADLPDPMEPKPQKNKKRKQDDDLEKNAPFKKSKLRENADLSLAPMAEDKKEEITAKFDFSNYPKDEIEAKLAINTKVLSKSNREVSETDDFRNLLTNILNKTPSSRITYLLDRPGGKAFVNTISTDACKNIADKNFDLSIGYGLTPLMATALLPSCDPTIIDKLVEFKVDVNAVIDNKYNAFNGCSVLMLAAYHGNIGILKKFIKDTNAHFDVINSKKGRFDHWSILDFAIAGGHTEIVKLLLDSHRVPFNNNDDNEQPIWETAIKSTPFHHVETIRDLLTSYSRERSEFLLQRSGAAKKTEVEKALELGTLIPDEKQSAGAGSGAGSNDYNSYSGKTYGERRPTTGGLRLKKKSKPEPESDVESDKESDDTFSARPPKSPTRPIRFDSSPKLGGINPRRSHSGDKTVSFSNKGLFSQSLSNSGAGAGSGAGSGMAQNTDRLTGGAPGPAPVIQPPAEVITTDSKSITDSIYASVHDFNKSLAGNIPQYPIGGVVSGYSYSAQYGFNPYPMNAYPAPVPAPAPVYPQPGAYSMPYQYPATLFAPLPTGQPAQAPALQSQMGMFGHTPGPEAAANATPEAERSRTRAMDVDEAFRFN